MRNSLFYQFAREMSTKGEPIINRKSLKTCQTVKFRFTIALYAFPIVASLLIVAFMVRGLSNEASDQQFQRSKTKNSYQSRFLIGMQKNQIKQSLVSQKYFSNYCKNKLCQNQDIQALQSIVQLLRSQNQAFSSNSTDQKADDQPYKQQNLQNELQRMQKNQQSQFLYEKLIQYTLSPIKNPYFSSPQPKQQYLLGFIKQIFIQEDPYQGIEQLFLGSTSVWQVKGKSSFLTVQSDETLTPHVIEINSELSAQTQLNILGLLFTPSNEMLAQKLGSYKLRPGLNIYQCKISACNQEYSMIMFRVQQLKFSRLKVYRKILF